MSLFRREPETPGAPRVMAREAGAPPSGRRMATTVAAGSRVEGTIGGSNEVVIEGELVGNVRVDAVVIVGPSGQVVGELIGRSVQVGGKVRGDVLGRERVELTPSATLEGNVRSPRVVIAEGAFFKGKVEMGEVEIPPTPAELPARQGKLPEGRPDGRADQRPDQRAEKAGGGGGDRHGDGKPGGDRLADGKAAVEQNKTGEPSKASDVHKAGEGRK